MVACFQLFASASRHDLNIENLLHWVALRKKIHKKYKSIRKSHLKLFKSIAIFQNPNSDFPIEGILSEKGPFYQHNRKCMENIVENIFSVQGPVPWIFLRKF